MSTVPVPKPRALSHDKRPIPLPRTNVPKLEETEVTKAPSAPQNTLTRRISNTSKQIAEALSVPGRHSLKKKHRKSKEEQHEEVEKHIIQTQSPEIFNTIRFESPLTINQPTSQPTSEPSSLTEENELYQNLNTADDIRSDEEAESLPPPSHPPPPLPDMSFYDTPPKNKQTSFLVRKTPPVSPRAVQAPSLPYIPPPTSEPCQNSPPRPAIPALPERPPPTPTRPTLVPQHTSGASIFSEERTAYEAVFPVYPVFSSTADSDGSDNDSKGSTLDRMQSTRPESWNFYDPVTLTDSTYGNVASYKKERYVFYKLL